MAVLLLPGHHIAAPLNFYFYDVLPACGVLWREVLAVRVVGNGALRYNFHTIFSKRGVYLVDSLHKLFVFRAVDSVEKSALYSIGRHYFAQSHPRLLVAVTLAEKLFQQGGGRIHYFECAVGGCGEVQ